MAHFIGGVQGGRGEATRLGHKSTGLDTWAKGWRGTVYVSLYYDEERKEDRFKVRLRTVSGETTLAEGKLGDNSKAG